MDIIAFMSYKIINRVDPTLYLILSIVGFVIPEQIYKLFLLNPDAVLSSTEATIVRANGVGVIFAALFNFFAWWGRGKCKTN